MAATPRHDVTTSLVSPATTSATPAADRRQWWADVQVGVSALLTEAAHPAVTPRLAG